ncbi:unnamed protein product [Caenorhabditis nigoni]
MGIMKIFVTRSGMSEMWRVLPDACRAEAKILKSQGIKEHKVPFFFAFKMDGFQFSEFKSPIKNWSEFCSIWFNFRVWYADALLTAGLLFNGKRIPDHSYRRRRNESEGFGGNRPTRRNVPAERMSRKDIFQEKIVNRFVLANGTDIGWWAAKCVDNDEKVVDVRKFNRANFEMVKEDVWEAIA